MKVALDKIMQVNSRSAIVTLPSWIVVEMGRRSNGTEVDRGRANDPFHSFTVPAFGLPRGFPLVAFGFVTSGANSCSGAADLSAGSADCSASDGIHPWVKNKRASCS